MISLNFAGVDVMRLLRSTQNALPLTPEQRLQVAILKAKVGTSNKIDMDGINVTARLTELYARLEAES